MYGNPDDPVLTLSNPDFAEFDACLQALLRENHPRIMNLEKPIPKEYPWEQFLHKHFSEPPFELMREDYEVIIVGKHKILKIRDSRKPTTFYSLLRFLEFFRGKLGQLEANLGRIEDKHEQLKRTANESAGIRTILRSQSWNYESISNKHIIVQNALNQKTRLENILKKMETMLAQKFNVTSKWQYLIEPFYKKVIEYINDNFTDGSFNLRMFYPVKTMETKLAPMYSDSMLLAIELNDAVQQTTAFLKGKK